MSEESADISLDLERKFTSKGYIWAAIFVLVAIVAMNFIPSYTQLWP